MSAGCRSSSKGFAECVHAFTAQRVMRQNEETGCGVCFSSGMKAFPRDIRQRRVLAYRRNPWGNVDIERVRYEGLCY